MTIEKNKMMAHRFVMEHNQQGYLKSFDDK